MAKKYSEDMEKVLRALAQLAGEANYQVRNKCPTPERLLEEVDRARATLREFGREME